MNQQPTTPWPEGVLARYLTVGGATVDLTTPHTERQVGEHATVPMGNGLSVQRRPETVIDVTITARCSGCLDSHEDTYLGLYPSALKDIVGSHYGQDAREWAQDHASECRAMPRPEASR
ncbi:hypothetical protein [Streptomyces sp. NPDC047028]|uniref:hypothetical protein n=1 Tax=Streptomyces sp. NPDC047028 TaxID=3155793 RepID=UPI0033DE1EEA